MLCIWWVCIATNDVIIILRYCVHQLCIEGVRKRLCCKFTMSGKGIRLSKKRVYATRAAKINKKLKKARLDLSAN
jgi:hypothetical protein